MLSENAKKLIAERRRAYIESMPAKRKAIQQCMDQVKTAVQQGETNLCEKLFQHVHRLAGSAGSYGFDTLSQAASSVDRYLIANSHRADDPTDLTARLQKLLAEIDNVIQKNG